MPAAFTDMKSGSFSSWTEAGEMNYAQISKLNATFDFEHDKLCVVPRR